MLEQPLGRVPGLERMNIPSERTFGTVLLCSEGMPFSGLGFRQAS